jgi:hypothetical protein
LRDENVDQCRRWSTLSRFTVTRITTEQPGDPQVVLYVHTSAIKLSAALLVYSRFLHANSNLPHRFLFLKTISEYNSPSSMIASSSWLDQPSAVGKNSGLVGLRLLKTARMTKV